VLRVPKLVTIVHRETQCEAAMIAGVSSSLRFSAFKTPLMHRNRQVSKVRYRYLYCPLLKR